MGVGRSLDLQPLKRLPLELSYLSDWAPSYPTRLPLDCCAVDKQFKTLKEADDSLKADWKDMVKEPKDEWEKVKAERLDVAEVPPEVPPLPPEVPPREARFF